MAHRGCVISLDNICYICDEYTVKSQQRNISHFVKMVYFAYFKLILGDPDKAWAPHKVCRRCEEDLRLWFKSKKTAFRFGIPMIWREQKNHTTDCYFCSIDVKGLNTKNKKKISYPNLDSPIHPVSHCSVSHPPPNLEDILSDADDSETFALQNESSSDFSVDEGPQLFSQIELNDLVRDLGFTKDAPELLDIDRENLLSISLKRQIWLHCNDVCRLMKCFEIEYDLSEWRLFIDSSKTYLKAVLMHNGNASLSMGHSVDMEENYND
ncbi:hypothetical protein ACJJTC_006318 [Scirpophaga incertulas]